MNRDRCISLVLVGMLLVVSFPVSAKDADEPKDKAKDEPRPMLTIVSPVKYKDGLEIRDAVKTECALLERVPAYIKEFAQQKGPVQLEDTAADAKGKTLAVEIVEIRESGTVGPKSLTITGELRENGKVIGTITARRSSMGGPLAAFGGACGILHRCAKALGKDLAGWIEKPAMDVELTN